MRPSLLNLATTILGLLLLVVFAYIPIIMQLLVIGFIIGWF